MLESYTDLTPAERAVFRKGMETMAFLIAAGWQDYRELSLKEIQPQCVEMMHEFVSQATEDERH